MIYQPKWEWDSELRVGYLDLQEDQSGIDYRTESLGYANVTINIDVDANGYVSGIEVLS